MGGVALVHERAGFQNAAAGAFDHLCFLQKEVCQVHVRGCGAGMLTAIRQAQICKLGFAQPSLEVRHAPYGHIFSENGKLFCAWWADAFFSHSYQVPHP